MIRLVRSKAAATGLHWRAGLIMAGERAEDAKHDGQDKTAATANDQWEKDREDRATNGGVVGFGEADAFYDETPDAADESAAKRNNHEWVCRTAGKAEDAEGCFKRAFCSADQHKTEMKDGGADKEARGDKDRDEDDNQGGAEAKPDDPGESVAIAHDAEGTHEEAEEKVEETSNAAAEDRINEGLAEAALRFHAREGDSRIEQDELKGFEEGGKETQLLAAVPGQPVCRTRAPLAAGVSGVVRPGNCERGDQVAMPSRQPRSVGRKRPLRRPSLISSSEKMPSFVSPRFTCMFAMARVVAGEGPGVNRFGG